MSKQAALLLGLVVLGFTAALAAPLAAQDNQRVGEVEFHRVEGEVLDAQSQLPIAAAIVVLPTMGLTTVTDDFGYFNFDGVPAGDFPLRVMRMGYIDQNADVVVTGSEVHVVRMEPQPVSLGEIRVDVIRPEELEWRASGTVLGVIGPVEMEELRIRTQSLEQILTSRPLSRTRYVQARSTAGLGCLRVTTALAGGGCAAMVVDGVLLTQESADWVYQMNPEEIFAIRFLHGADAGVRYGYAGADGVLLIETRRGR
ncbi:MAG: carboxypeptidase-like regulatory domain-containing protein [Longimicrobiales bacterium]